MTTIENRLLTMQHEASALLAAALVENNAVDIGELFDRGLLVGDTAAAAHCFAIVTELLEGMKGLAGSEMTPEHRQRLNIVVMSKLLLAIDAGGDARFDKIVTSFDSGMSFATRALLHTVLSELVAHLERESGDWRMATEMAVLDQQIELDAEHAMLQEQIDAEQAQTDDEEAGS